MCKPLIYFIFVYLYSAWNWFYFISFAIEWAWEYRLETVYSEQLSRARLQWTLAPPMSKILYREVLHLKSTQSGFTFETLPWVVSKVKSLPRGHFKCKPLLEWFQSIKPSPGWFKSENPHPLTSKPLEVLAKIAWVGSGHTVREFRRHRHDIASGFCPDTLTLTVFGDTEETI